MASEQRTVKVLRVRGKVQGVGFRPHVAKLARARGLRGWVRNDADGVEIALAADDESIARFKATLLATLPPLARVDTIESGSVTVPGSMSGADDLFCIVRSPRRAPTEACARTSPPTRRHAERAPKMRSQGERRFRYPFTNCTHCGPRYSLVTGIPYDRANTTMNGFPFCTDCRHEYEDEGDRRYHAQPIACHVCGPRTLARKGGRSRLLLRSICRARHGGRRRGHRDCWRHRRGERRRRLPSLLRRDQRERRKRAPQAEAPRRKAVRAYGQGPRRRSAICARVRARGSRARPALRPSCCFHAWRARTVPSATASHPT